MPARPEHEDPVQWPQNGEQQIAHKRLQVRTGLAGADAHNPRAHDALAEALAVGETIGEQVVEEHPEDPANSHNPGCAVIQGHHQQEERCDANKAIDHFASRGLLSAPIPPHTRDARCLER